MDGNDFSAELRAMRDKCAEKRNQQLGQSINRVVCRRPPSGLVKYAVGVILKKKTDDNICGPILSWDLNCKESDEWIEKNDIRNLTRGVDQPFYKFLSGSKDEILYEAEGNRISRNWSMSNFNVL